MAAVLPTFICEAAFGFNPGDASPTWTDVSAYLRSFHITRGRQYELNQMQAGTCDITLKNLDRRFDPTYSSSPYYPYLRPMVPVRLRSPKAIPADASLTVSGNEITDATRTTNTQGDGKTAPSGVGIWESSTNLCTNGGFESNTTGWASNQLAASIARDTSTAKFGAACLRAQNDTGGAAFSFDANNFSSRATATAGLPYTSSAWVKDNNTGGAQVKIEIEFRDGSNAVLSRTASALVALTGSWQRLSITATAPVNTATVFARITTAGINNGQSWFIDGVQIEQKNAATPYIETNGGSGTRAAARVQELATALSATTGCIVLRYSPGFATTAMPGGGTGKEYLFDWRDDANNRLTGYFDETSKKFTMERYNASSGSQAQSAAQTLVIDTAINVEFSWTATTIGVRVNGGTKTTTANTNIPTLAATLFDIGGTFAVGTPSVGINECDGRILWAATFSTIPTDADALTIGTITATPTKTNGYYDHDASVLLWPASSTITSYWPAVTSGYRIPSDAYLFTGYVERFPQNRTGPTYAETQVQAVDGFELLTNSVLPSHATPPTPSYPQELSGARIGRVLDDVGWSSSARSISAGQSQVIAYAYSDVDFVQPLSHLQDVTTSELGNFFMSADGKATFRDRYTSIASTVLGTFTDQPSVDTSAVGYADLQKSFDKDLIYNDWRGTRSGGAIVYQSIDTLSIAKYTQRAQSRTPLLPDDLSVQSQMQALLNTYKEPSMRVSQITVTPGNSVAAWLQVLQRELLDRLTVREHPPGGGAPFVQDSLIQAIDLEVDKDAVSAKCVYSLLQANPNSYLILNDATSGTIDSTNTLGY